ncbi:MAG: helix-turn-helix transcriptional regulator [Clostridia bacterium]|nr:helix-turn-helix transcriptional regulator [Clostridia bacterium]
MKNAINDSFTKHDKYNNMEKIAEFIRNNYNKNHSAEYYAEMCNLNKYYFIKLFGEYTGVSPQHFRTQIRIEKAKELLKTTSMHNGEIAELVGYSSSYYFSRIFKTYTGVSPNEFRKNNK